MRKVLIGCLVLLMGCISVQALKDAKISVDGVYVLPMVDKASTQQMVSLIKFDRAGHVKVMTIPAVPGDTTQQYLAQCAEVVKWSNYKLRNDTVRWKMSYSTAHMDFDFVYEAKFKEDRMFLDIIPPNETFERAGQATYELYR